MHLLEAGMAGKTLRKLDFVSRAGAMTLLICLLAPFIVTAVFAQEPEALAAAAPENRGWITLLPPVVAIGIALVFRSVIPALFIGIWCGTLIIIGPALTSGWTAFLEAFDTHIVNAIVDADRVRVLLFTMMLGGMIGILGRNGGMQGIVDRVTRFASTAVRGQILTAGLGLVIFFDDVANTLLIGKTMRPVIDKLRISREKLAYLVDSTAAPVAGIAFASTWVGYEVSVIGSTIEGIPDLNTSPYLIFLGSVPYIFYSFITLFMVFAVAYTGRDFGPMYHAEIRARQRAIEEPDVIVDGDDAASGDAPRSYASSALIPIGVVVATLFSSLLITGEGESFQQILSSADSYLALMWASLLGVASAAIVTVLRRVLDLNQVIEAWFEGVTTTLFAVIVLVLSWTLADIVQTLGTAEYVTAATSGYLPLFLLPTSAFVLSGIVAFTTGTSWGTMGIMMPLVLPLSWALLTGTDQPGISDQMYLFHGSVAGVLAGAIWGDHCSPISDTTVLSSLASECDHIEHVRTQLPYAITSGLLAILLGTLPTGFGVPWWICWPISFAAVIAILKIVGRPVEENSKNA
jgi:Na+/H+ antiporter NhaC